VKQQGPALLVYNDGVFSDEDFESIQSIGDSKKRGQLAKTGRFGIGFNSCYHLTEVPTFLSVQSYREKKKVIDTVTLYSTYTRALTLRVFGSAPSW
jgi:hypothetical protein